LLKSKDRSSNNSKGGLGNWTGARAEKSGEKGVKVDGQGGPKGGGETARTGAHC